MSATILICDRYATESIERLKQLLLKSNVAASVVATAGVQPTAQELKSAVALLIRSRTKIDAELLGRAPDLKVVITSTSGYDHIDLAETAKRDIVAMYTPEANSQSAAELTLTLMLGVLRRVNESTRLLRDGRWRDELGTGNELRGKTVGLIGLGRVGSRVAHLLQAFDCEVLAFDPYQSDEVFERLKIPRLGLTEVLAQAEILSLHVPLNSETRRLIRAETLELTQDGLILINTSRGKVIDESALVAALESKQIQAAGLDVFEHEPLARESRLRKMPQVLITPHIGAYTEEAFTRASESAIEKLIAFLKNGEIVDKISDNLPHQ